MSPLDRGVGELHNGGQAPGIGSIPLHTECIPSPSGGCVTPCPVPYIGSVAVSVSSTGTQATITWSQAVSTASQTFVYGLSTSYGSSSTVVSNSVSLSGLIAGAVYYYKITATSSGSCLTQTQTYTGSFWTSPSGGGSCPKGTLSAITNVMQTVSSGWSSVTVSWSPTSTVTYPYGVTESFTYTVDGGSHSVTPTSHSAVISISVYGTTYSYTITDSSPCYSPATYSSSFATPSIALSGHAWIAGAPGYGTAAPAYGASVAVAGHSAAVVTGTAGSYQLSLTDVTVGMSYTLSASAPGFYQGSSTITISSDASIAMDVNLKLWVTNDVESHTEWYDLNAHLGGVSSSWYVYSSYYTSSNTIAVVTSSTDTSAPFPTPSKSTGLIRAYGYDGSATTTGDAWTYFYVSPASLGGAYSGLPLSTPMVLAFNAYVLHAPCHCKGENGPGRLAVDAEFSDGTFVRNVLDGRGSYILDGNGQRIYAANQRLAPGTWVRVVADLTELRGKTLTGLFIDYDNGGTGGTADSYSYFQVYFDDIRLELAFLPRNIIDGGFEFASPYGWRLGGSQPPVVENLPAVGTHSGANVLMVGVDPHHYSAVTSSYVSEAVQELRVPNIPNNPGSGPAGLYLVLWYYLGTQETSTSAADYQEVAISDRTTMETTTVFHGLSNGQVWTKVRFDVTPFAGHILWITLRVYQDANGLSTWAYFDDVTIVPYHASLTEESRGGSSARLHFDPSVYRPSSALESSVPISMQGGIGQAGSNEVASVGIDIFDFNHDQLTGYDHLDFGATTAVHVSGFPLYINDVCVTVNVVENQGDSSYQSSGFSSQYGWQLSPNGGFTPLDPTKNDITFLTEIFGAEIGPISDAASGLFNLGTSPLGYEYNLQGPSVVSPCPSSGTSVEWGTTQSVGGPATGGGTVTGLAEIGSFYGSGGVYVITISVKADIYELVCSPYPNAGCSDGPLYNTISTSFALVLDDYTGFSTAEF